MVHLRFLFHTLRGSKRILLLLVIPLFSCISARAQYSNSDSRYGISIGSDYDAPVGNFAYTFKPTINYNLNLMHHYDSFTGSISFGYHQYKPKQDTFYYQANSTNFGTVSYQNFPVYSFYLGLTYDLAITEQFKIYAGINLGLYYTRFAFHSSDFLVDDTENLNEEDVYFAPRLGITYMLNDNIGIGIEGKYNFFAPSGDSEYNDRVGTLYNSYSAGIRLSYNF